MSESDARYRSFVARGGVADFSERVKVRLTGADRVRYLNGQITANVLKLAPGVARSACVTTAKGRLCADVFIHATTDALFLDADAAVRETLPPRLDHYIISDDVVLEDVSNEMHLLHLVGEAIERADLFEGAALTSHANRLGRPGLDVWIDTAVFAKVWDALAGVFAVLDESLIESMRIEAGIPRWGCELDENTLPPEAGLERTHIDYDKGCYVGQEVISRLKSIGHVNRRLAGFLAPDKMPLTTGMQLFRPGADSGEIGVLTSAGWSFALEKSCALGYLKRGSPMGELLARNTGEPGPGRIVFAQELPLTS